MPLARDIPPFPVPPEIESSAAPEAETARDIIESVNGYDGELLYPDGLSLLGGSEFAALNVRDTSVLSSSGWQREWQSMPGEDLFSGWTPGWSIAQRIYSCTTYIYNGIDAYYDWLKDVVVDQGGALLRFEAWVRPAEWEDMYMWYMAIHNTSDHSGHWYHYNSSGTCTDSGSW
ncbi:MAG: hypothetical protein GVY14_12700 [Spirochaetes bacterium]|nr:hypothetical protein [Spirochaetota bacterium]